MILLRRPKPAVGFPAATPVSNAKDASREETSDGANLAESTEAPGSHGGPMRTSISHANKRGWSF